MKKVLLTLLIIGFLSGCGNNNQDKNKTKEEQSTNEEEQILKEKFDKEHWLSCISYFKPTQDDALKGITSQQISISVYYDTEEDDTFFIDPSYTLNYDTYDNALNDYENQIEGYENWTTNVEENVSDGTGEITIETNSLPASGQTVKEFVKALRDDGAECANIK